MCRVHAALAWHDAETRCVSATTGRARRGGGGDARVLCVARRHAAGCRCVSRVWLHKSSGQGACHIGGLGVTAIKFPEFRWLMKHDGGLEGA